MTGSAESSMGPLGPSWNLVACQYQWVMVGPHGSQLVDIWIIWMYLDGS